jgi:hypothetical protein
VSDSVIPLFRDPCPEAKTAGALIDFANAMPRSKVAACLKKHLREVDRLERDGGMGGAALLRQLIVVGTLINRAVFDLYGMPKRRSHEIGAPETPSPSGGRPAA